MNKSINDLDHIEAYDYSLPEDLIATHPSDRRDESRLMVVNRSRATLTHHRFNDLINILERDDLLVFNNTQVIPGRILTRKATGGRVELLVLDIVSPSGEGRWTRPASGRVRLKCMTRSSKPLRQGMNLYHERSESSDPFCVEDCAPGHATVSIAWPSSAIELLEKYGTMPLPPYIVQRRNQLGANTDADYDARRYQTVYALNPGAIAAPTAGLHFTESLLKALESKGVHRAFLTLRVGPGTFRPVNTDLLSEHVMHEEEYCIDTDLADAIARTRERGGRIIAVGTTSARALEAEARRPTPFEPGTRATDIFLRPGTPFLACDGLITNFHLPRSTLLALVAAFCGHETMRTIYAEAISSQYRFYSYGDSSIIL